MFREKVSFKTLTEAKADHTNELKSCMDQIVNCYSIRVSIVKLIALILAKKRFWYRYILTIQPETKMKIKKVTDVGGMQNTPKFLWSDLRQTLEQHFVPKEEFSYVLTYLRNFWAENV